MVLPAASSARLPKGRTGGILRPMQPHLWHFCPSWICVGSRRKCRTWLSAFAGPPNPLVSLIATSEACNLVMMASRFGCSLVSAYLLLGLLICRPADQMSGDCAVLIVPIAVLSLDPQCGDVFSGQLPIYLVPPVEVISGLRSGWGAPEKSTSCRWYCW